MQTENMLTANPADFLEKLRQDRRTWHTIDGMEFCIERPAEFEALRFMDSCENAAGSDLENTLAGIELACRYLVDWKLTTNDFFGDGGEMEVPFTEALRDEFISDHLKIGERVSALVFESIRVNRERIAAEKKL